MHQTPHLVKPGKTMGSTGHWPVSSGDPPEETEKRLCQAIPPKNAAPLSTPDGESPHRQTEVWVKPGKGKIEGKIEAAFRRHADYNKP